MVGHEIWYPSWGPAEPTEFQVRPLKAIASPPTDIATQNVVVGQEIEESDPPAFKCCEANHAPFFQKCTSPLLSTAAQNVVDGQDTALRDERSRTSTVCAFDHVPVVGAAEATSPSVMTHAVSNTMVITLRRMQ
jgi:hypothetical protein